MLLILTLMVSLITSLIFKNTRIIGAIGFSVLAWLAGSADGRTTTDYQVYQTHYYALGSEVSPFEKGYTVLSEYFNNLGFSYSDFRLIFAFCAFAILFFGVLLFTNNVAMFTWIYGSTVFFNDVTQIRNLMMIAMIILGCGLFIKSNLIIKLLGIAAIVLSTQFHDLGFLFIMIIPIYFIPKKYITKALGLVVGISLLVTMIIKIFGSSGVTNLIMRGLGAFSSRTDSVNNVQSHFSRGTSLSTIFLIGVTVLLVLYLSTSFTTYIQENMNINANKLKILYSGVFVSVFTLPLILLSPDYSRISRNAFLFFIIIIVIYYSGIINKKMLVKNRTILLIVFLALFTYIHTTIWGPEYQNSIPYIARIKDSNESSGD